MSNDIKNYMNILEKLDSKFISPYDHYSEVLIYKNPSHREMLSIKSKTSENELRGFIVGHAVYIWDAHLAIHNDVASFLGVKPNGTFIIDSSNQCLNSDAWHTLDLELPMLKRMMNT